MRRLSPVLVAAILTSLAPLALAAKEKAAAAKTAVSLSGKGQATVTPRRVTVTMTLSSKDQQAEKSRDSNATQVSGLKQAIGGLAGIKPSHIQLGAPTTYKDVKRDNAGNETFRGWITEQSIIVTTPAKGGLAGKVFDTGTQHGAELSQPQPLVSPTMVKNARNRAERSAVKDALARAKKLAADLGLTTAEIVGVREPGTRSFGGDDFGLESVRASRSFAPSSTPTEFDVGKQTVSQTREVDFRLK